MHGRIIVCENMGRESEGERYGTDLIGYLIFGNHQIFKIHFETCFF